MPVAVRAAAVYNFTLTPRDPIPLVRGWNKAARAAPISSAACAPRCAIRSGS
jgi:hypothetical protein